MANDNSTSQDATNEEQPKHSTWKDIISEEAQKLNSEFPLSGGETEEDLKAATASTHESTDTTEKPAEEHHSLAERLFDSLKKINTEFPLSGGETNEDLEEVTGDE